MPALWNSRFAGPAGGGIPQGEPCAWRSVPCALFRYYKGGKGRGLKYQGEGKDCQVSQSMDGDGDNQAASDLICSSKDKTSHQTGDRDSMTNGVAEHEDHSADDKGHNNPPSPQEAVENSPKEKLLCCRTYHPANNEKEDKVHSLCR